MAELHQIFIFDNRKKLFLSFKNQEIFQFKVIIVFFESDGLTLGTLQDTAFPEIFFPEIFCVKRRHLSETAKTVTITSSS